MANGVKPGKEDGSASGCYIDYGCAAGSKYDGRPFEVLESMITINTEILHHKCFKFIDESKGLAIWNHSDNQYCIIRILDK